MIRVFFLIFEPSVAWARIAEARRGFIFILTTYLVPTILAVTALEGWSLMKWGKWQPKFQMFREFTHREIIGFEVIQALLLLLMVFVIAFLVLKVSDTFHGRHSYLQSFTTVAYGLSPLFLLRLLDIAPTMNPGASWGVGIMLTIWILYQGIPRIMQPDPTHAFGLYLSSILLVVLTSGLLRLITAMYLLGYVTFEHSWLTRTFPQLLR
jgi:hypothetical protein